MTAPPTHLPLFTSDPHLARASSYFSSAPNTPSDSGRSWSSMPPHHEPAGLVRPPRKSKSPSVMADAKKSASHGGFQFITAENPADFKKKEHMTIVRKKAMDHHLATEMKPKKTSRTAKTKSVLHTESSDGSSVVSHDMTVATGSTTLSHNTPSTSRNANFLSTSSKQKRYDTSARASSIQSQSSPERILEAGPIVEPSGPSPLPYDGHKPPLFESIGKALDPFQTMFQSSHPHVSVEELKNACSRYFGTKSLGRYWIPTALDHPHTFLGTLCLATAYNDVEFELPQESLQTIALRQEVIHLVGRNILDPANSVADHNLMAVIQLIISEVIGREESGLKYHENGIESMIEKRGGLQQLGLEGRLASSISWISLASSILREERPRQIYLDHCAATSGRVYPATATIPESPIYLPYPRTNFQTLSLERSTGCSPKALELLGEIRSMIDVFLQETKQARRNSLTLTNIFRRITNLNIYPPISEIRRTGRLQEADHRYEAIRLTSIIQATAIMERMPLSKAVDKAVHYAQRMLPPIFTSSSVFKSTESLVSPFDPRRHSTATDLTSSPAYSSYDISPGWQNTASYFDHTAHRDSDASIKTHRSSQSSNVTYASDSTSLTRPSFSSTRSSELRYFPPPIAPTPSATEILLGELKEAIKTSNMSHCWSEMAGVLLWIGLVVGAATKDCQNKIIRKYFSAITMRAGIMLCFEHYQGINATVLRMNEIIEALDTTHTPNQVPQQESTSKRRKPSARN